MQNKPNFSSTESAFAWRTTRELYESYLLFQSIGSPLLVKTGTTAIQAALKLHLPITALIKSTIFKQFCGGTTLEDCRATIETMAKYKVKSIPDYSIEAGSETQDFDSVQAEILHAVDFASKNPNVAFVVFKVTGMVRYALLEKLNAQKPLDAREEKEWLILQNRVEKICSAAKNKNIPILIDAEESWVQSTIDTLAWQMMQKFNRDSCIVYNTLQMYRHDRLSFLKHVTAEAKNQGFFYGAKLVRGAYMEKERARAQQLNYPSPIHPNKKATDQAMDAAIAFCLDHHSHLGTFIGTHNEKSTSLAIDLMNEKQIEPNHPRVWFSQLFGMSDNLSFNLGLHGYNAAKYLPYGPVKAVLPYLFRRAEENTAIQGQAGRELKLIARELKRRRM